MRERPNVPTESGRGVRRIASILPESGIGDRGPVHHNSVMEDESRFLNEFFCIVNGALRFDIDSFRDYTSFLADKLDESGEKQSAVRLRRLLEESDHTLRPAGVSVARTFPVDSESRFPLIERVNVKTVKEPPVVITDQQRAVLGEFLSVAKS